MQKIKYLIFSILFLFGLICSGEMYQSYMDIFNNFYDTTFYMQEGIPRDTMLSDIQNTAKKNHIQVFCKSAETENIFTKHITIYGDEDVIRTLKSDYFMREGKTGSIFSGTTTVECYDFFDLPEEMLLMENEPTFYLIGSLDDARQMKSELIDIYGGNFPKEQGYDNLPEKISTIVLIWCIITVLVCFLSFYALALSQRELMVRCTMGESKFRLFLQIALSDTIFLILWFALCAAVLQRFSNVLFLAKYTIPMVLVCIVSDILTNCFLFTFKARAAFSKVAGQKTLMIGTYLIKTLSCLLVVMVLTFQAATIKEAVRFYQQRKFFEEHSSYNYIRIYDKGDVIEPLTTNLYRKYAENLLILDPMYDLGDNGEREVVFANKKAYEVLKGWIPELETLDLNADICLLKHCDTPLSEEEISFLESNLRPFFEGEERDFQIVEYQKDSEIIEIEEDFLNYSEWCKNPTIVLIKNDSRHLLSDEEVQSGSLEKAVHLRSYNFMLNVPEDELKSYVEHFGCGATVTNVYDYYLYRWEILKRSLYISIVFIILILLLEVSISLMIIKLEYRINATELALKKTLGYSNFERIKKLYLISFICMGVSLLSSGIVLYFVRRSSLIVALIAVLLIALLEITMIHSYSVKYEKENVPKILKGGDV